MKKLFIHTSFLLVVMLSVVSCTKDLTSLNQDIKKPSAVDPAALFAYAEKRMADGMTSTNVNLNVFRLLVQQWAETTYPDESQYDLTTRLIPDKYWTLIYTDVLKNLAESKSLIDANTELDAKVKANQLAQINVMSVYAYSILVNVYGMVPYSKSLDIENLFPDYETGEVIYADLIKRLDASLAAFDETAGSFDNSDLIYRGDVAAWKKFTNSLKLRLGMTIADADPAAAKTAVEQAAAGVFTSNSDNALFPYSTIPPNTNPLWEDLILSGRKDFIATDTIITIMSSFSDPRLAYYFTKIGGVYKGGIAGSSNDYSAFSHQAPLLEKKDLKGVFVDYVETEFYLAEAAERGFTVPGTAALHYTNAITASILYWGGTAEEVTTYLLRPDVAYATATGNYKEKIGIQKWIALYNRGVEGWTEWRRLDYPKLRKPKEALSDMPVRFPYPVDEQNLNQEKYDAAVAKIGGDLVTVHVFWDKF
jgi:hypothetical protein